jgi:hypothetical protein
MLCGILFYIEFFAHRGKIDTYSFFDRKKGQHGKIKLGLWKQNKR